MQLAFDSADRLVELIEARRGSVPAEDAARALYALRHVPAGLARSLLADVVEGDVRLAWRGASVGLADPPGAELALEAATYVVVDLETTGLSPGTSAICEIGAIRVQGLELGERFETLVNPRRPLPAPIAALTGIDPLALRSAPPVELAVRRFLEFAGDAVLVAHNARFDMAFLDREVERLTGRRIASPVVDTLWLARRVLVGRTPRMGLASLSHFFGTATRPCHRALADAEATAEILLALIGLAQERGAESVAQLVDLAAPRARRLAGKRSLVAGAPPHPGVYLFRDRNDEVLYVGRARDLRARLRSYFRTDRQRTACGRGGARRARASRVARARLRARGGAGGAPAPARAAAAGERAQRAPRPLRLPSPPRRRLVRHRDAWSAWPAQEPGSRTGRGSRAGGLGGRAGGGAATAPREAQAPLCRPPLRGCCAAPRPDRGPRGRRRRPRRARAAACARALPRRAGRRAGLPASLLRLGRPGRRRAHAAARRGGSRRGGGRSWRRSPVPRRQSEPRMPTSCSDRVVPAPAPAGARGAAAGRAPPCCLVLLHGIRRHRDLRRPACGRG